ncbi:MAG: FAD-dependent oxidoreductase [Synechococcus sp.]
MSASHTVSQSRLNFPDRSHAVVLGASMAGLLAARVLSTHFQQVTLIERDELLGEAANRRGVPQGRHLHTLLVKGEQILTQLFPGLVSELIDAGAVKVDLPGDVLWFQEGGHKIRCRSGITMTCSSRSMLEYHVRRRVLAIENLTCLQGYEVRSLNANADGRRIAGVKIRPTAKGALEESLDADLVVDATGRGSKSPKWLESLGYSKPVESVVKVDVSYTTRIFRQNASLLPTAKGIVTMPIHPDKKRGGALLPIEGGRWIVTLVGWLGDRAPATDSGFLNFAKTLASPDIYNAIARAEPLTAFFQHRFPSNRRYHYETMTRFPDGYLVMGDAMCSFNPFYAQGMSVSAMEAEALARCLQEAAKRNSLSGIARQFFPRAARAIVNPWRLTVSEDLRFPTVKGPKPLGSNWIEPYIVEVHKTTLQDCQTTHALFQVLTLTHSPQILFHPKIMLRVARNCFDRKQG